MKSLEKRLKKQAEKSKLAWEKIGYERDVLIDVIKVMVNNTHNEF